MKLRYNNFPTDWKEGLLIGNGRLNGILWGDSNKDIISLNHERLWTGKYGDRKNRTSYEYLPKVRELLKEKDYFRGTALASLAFGGDGGISPYPRQEDSFKPAGELVFTYDREQENLVERVLDIQSGIATLAKKDIIIEAFADCVTEIMVTSWKSRNKFSGTLHYERQEDGAIEDIRVDKNNIIYDCKIDSVSSFKVIVKVYTDGILEYGRKEIHIRNATYIKTFTNIGVSFNDIEKEFNDYPFPAIDIDGLKKKHSEKFLRAMSKTDISIADNKTDEVSDLYINERIEKVRNGNEDVNLIEIYAKFGIYLMVSGSICGKLPLNLQGKWNCDIVPPWFGDYHFNINIQMNYWFTEQLGYPEYSRQLFEYVNKFAESGREAAKSLYGCNGTVLSLNGDHWAISTPEAYNYAAWIGGAAWMAQHYWWHYQYNGDKDFLRNEAYPFFKSTVDFYMDYIEVDDNDIAQIMPSQSPENRFEGTGYFPVSMCISSAMDVQLAYDAFTYAIDTSKLLNIDQERCAEWEQIRDRLPDFKVGKDGRLLEWDNEDKIEVEKGHRHYSHLYGVFPSTLFNSINRTEQFEAGRKSLEYRLDQNGGGTGWSRAWAACLFARLQDGEAANHQLSYLLTELSSSALLDLHPRPPRCTVRNEDTEFVFQIDGNLGATRAVLECIIQCYEGKIFLLPALPTSWEKGSITGVKTIGGHIIDLAYEKGKITSLKIEMGFEEKIVIDNGNRLLDGDEEVIIQGEKGKVYTLV
ncbi:glycosyl hydrolase family 95 catalytic domain-containing protein [Vallitalea guaymasensis]|uniref:glycosyl hydrolase family 95 catalytic domain-containing protein n=1 Tax=Vallitalea guaymasensis TaxID=1185412 RepID=UPI002353DF34|nr:glycoside hydrolase N-terminal domain-containing protein [Vallitalea guaymasensis]